VDKAIGIQTPTGGLATAVAVAVVALIGAILGGVFGMRYHLKIDAVGLDH